MTAAGAATRAMSKRSLAGAAAGVGAAGFDFGDFLLPFETFSAGYNGTPTNGTLWLYPGEYTFTGTLDKPMRIEPTSGIATIGS